MRGKKLLGLLLGLSMGAALSVGVSACDMSGILGGKNSSSQSETTTNSSSSQSESTANSTSQQEVDVCGVYYWEKIEGLESGNVVAAIQPGGTVEGKVWTKDYMKLILRSDGSADLCQDGEWRCFTYSSNQTELVFEMRDESFTATYSDGSMAWSFSVIEEGINYGTIYYWQQSNEVIPAAFCYGCGQTKETKIVDVYRLCDSCKEAYERSGSPWWESSSEYDSWESSSEYDSWESSLECTAWGNTSEYSSWWGSSSEYSSWNGSSEHSSWNGSSEHSSWNGSSEHSSWNGSSEHSSWNGSSEHSSSEHSSWNGSSEYSSWWESSSEYDSCGSSSEYSSWNSSSGDSSWWEDSSDSSSALQYEEIDGVYYSLASNGAYATVVGCDNSVSEIEILPTYQDVPVTSIGADAFSGCSSLTSIEIPDGVTSIGRYAFSGCSSLTSIEIPDSVTWIGYRAFNNCSGLEEITLPFVGATKDGTENTHFGYIFGTSSYSGKNSYVPSSLKKVTITSATSIGRFAFYECSSLTSVVIPDSVTSIGEGAFYKCSSLTSIEIPDSVTSIGESAFSGCSSLTSVVIPDRVTSIGESAFQYCSSLTSIEIPDNVTSIGDSAFSSCSSLTSVVIGDGVTSIGDYAFYNCSSLTIYCEAASQPSGWNSSWNCYYSCDYYSYYCPVVWNCNNNDVANDRYIYTVIDGIRYGIKDGEATVVRWQPRNIQTAIIPASITYKDTTYAVTSIGNSAFEDCSSLTSVVIGDGVTSIGEKAFYECSSLTSVVIGDSVTRIGEYAFYNCSSLEYTIKDGLKYLGNTNNPYLWLMDTETTRITTATIEDTCKVIGLYAFEWCSSLTSVIIPDSVTSIGDCAFRYCSRLTSVEIGNGVTSIGSGAFDECSRLTSIVIPDSVTEIGWDAFDYCSSLTNVVIGNGVTSIGGCAFRYCSRLAEVYYNGTASEWNKISIGSDNYYFNSAARYYYSEEEPTEGDNYWHYVDGVVTKW